MAADKKDKPKVKPDWDAIERDYRTGQFTLRELETKHGPSPSTVSRRAQKHGWTADLSVAVRQATNAAVIATLVADGCKDAQRDATETVKAAAELNKQVILSHRKDLEGTRNVAVALLQELGATALLKEHSDLLEEILAGEDPDPEQMAKARLAVQRALSVNTRISSIKSLAETFSKIQASERIAFSLDASGKQEDEQGSLKALLGQLARSAVPIAATTPAEDESE